MMRRRRKFVLIAGAGIIALGVMIAGQRTVGADVKQAAELTSLYVAQGPSIDGDAESMWDAAPAMTVAVSGGANQGSHDVTVKSLYSNDQIFFLVKWNDATESLARFPWEKQEDGSWIQLSDGSNHDESQYYEDKLAFIWNIDDSISGFNNAGCMVTCHVGESGKAFGNKYTASEGEMGDIWHWKSVRSNPEGYADDQYVDSQRYDEDHTGAGRHGDPSDGGGYVNNKNEDGTAPAFVGPEGANGPFWVHDAQKTEFVDTFAAGDQIPGIVVERPAGDRGDLDAKGVYSGDGWVLEVARDLDTGSDVDVQFADLAKTYHFGVAVFDNTQVRHSFQTSVSALQFGDRPTAVAARSWGQVKEMTR